MAPTRERDITTAPTSAGQCRAVQCTGLTGPARRTEVRCLCYCSGLLHSRYIALVAGQARCTSERSTPHKPMALPCQVGHDCCDARHRYAQDARDRQRRAMPQAQARLAHALQLHPSLPRALLADDNGSTDDSSLLQPGGVPCSCAAPCQQSLLWADGTHTPCRAERSRSSAFLSGFVVGGVVFGALGFLFAPQAQADSGAAAALSVLRPTRLLCRSRQRCCQKTSG